MAKEKKQPKKRGEKYETKLAVKGSFEDLVKLAVSEKQKEIIKEEAKGKEEEE